jgi:hypothetical protein
LVTAVYFRNITTRFAKVRERLAVSKQTTHKVHMERFNLKKLSEVEGRAWYYVEISNRLQL